MSDSQPRLGDLEASTEVFFRRHWLDLENGEAPRWLNWLPFLYGSVPNFQHGGCYALFVHDVLVYVGKGSSRGSGIYVDHGISRRLMAHVYCSAKKPDRRQLQLRQSWSDITALHTIGLPNREYLAPALEGFLIRSLLPARNGCV